MAGEGEFPKSDGDVLYGSDVNYLVTGKIQEVYTGTALNVDSSAEETKNGSYEMTAITDVKGADYLKIIINGQATCSTISNAGYVSATIQVQEVGDSYGTVWTANLAYTDGAINVQYNGATIIYYHELTSGQKTNGIQVKVLTYCQNGGNNAGTTWTNKQVVLELA